MAKVKEVTKQVKKQTKPITRTTAGLRDILFDEIEGLRSGTSNPNRANSVAKLACGIIDSARLDMEAQRYLRSTAKKLGGNGRKSASFFQLVH